MLITIIYDSGYGHTAKQAQAVADGSAPTGADPDTRLHQPKHEPRRGSPWRRVSGARLLDETGAAIAKVYDKPTRAA
jgi:hypothetical protein